MSLNPIRKYKIIAKISEFTVPVAYVISRTKDPLSCKDALY